MHTRRRWRALARPSPGRWLWTRLAGDLVDMVLLGSLLRSPRTQRRRTIAALVAVAGVRSGQTHVQRYLPRLLDHIVRGDLDPSFIVTHTMPLDEAPRGYETFLQKEEECVKVVLKAGASQSSAAREAARA